MVLWVIIACLVVMIFVYFMFCLEEEYKDIDSFTFIKTKKVITDQYTTVKELDPRDADWYKTYVTDILEQCNTSDKVLNPSVRNQEEFGMNNSKPPYYVRTNDNKVYAATIAHANEEIAKSFGSDGVHITPQPYFTIIEKDQKYSGASTTNVRVGKFTVTPPSRQSDNFEETMLAQNEYIVESIGNPSADMVVEKLNKQLVQAFGPYALLVTPKKYSQEYWDAKVGRHQPFGERKPRALFTVVGMDGSEEVFHSYRS